MHFAYFANSAVTNRRIEVAVSKTEITTDDHLDSVIAKYASIVLSVLIDKVIKDYEMNFTQLQPFDPKPNLITFANTAQ